MDIRLLLTKDHREVDALFKEFESLGERAFRSKEELARKICDMLDIHAKVEEMLFYPELETASATSDLIRESYVEHQQMKDRIAEIRKAKGDAPDFDAKMKVLKEDVKHHVDEEEDELFPEVEDVLREEKLVALGEEADALKKKEMRARGMETGEEKEEQPHA